MTHSRKSKRNARQDRQEAVLNLDGGSCTGITSRKVLRGSTHGKIHCKKALDCENQSCESTLAALATLVACAVSHSRRRSMGDSLLQPSGRDEGCGRRLIRSDRYGLRCSQGYGSTEAALQLWGNISVKTKCDSVCRVVV